MTEAVCLFDARKQAANERGEREQEEAHPNMVGRGSCQAQIFQGFAGASAGAGHADRSLDR